jgi:hypothetical protein
LISEKRFATLLTLASFFEAISPALIYLSVRTFASRGTVNGHCTLTTTGLTTCRKASSRKAASDADISVLGAISVCGSAAAGLCENTILKIRLMTENGCGKKLLGWASSESCANAPHVYIGLVAAYFSDYQHFLIFHNSFEFRSSAPVKLLGIIGHAWPMECVQRAQAPIVHHWSTV